jgi:acyl carrier protein
MDMREWWGKNVINRSLSEAEGNRSDDYFPSTSLRELIFLNNIRLNLQSLKDTMDEQLRQKIFGLIQQDINADPSNIDPDKPIRDQIALDSMQFIGVVARIELELGIELPMSVMEVKTLNEFLDVVEKEMPDSPPNSPEAG